MKKLCLLFALLCCTYIHSQSLTVWDLNSGAFPTVSASFYALDADGKQITDLGISDMEVRENDIKRNILDISCPQSTTVDISSVLCIDISSSMEMERLPIAQAAARQWIRMLNLGASECAITSFSGKSYLNQDFTVNRNLLNNAVSNLKCLDVTNYNEAFLNSYSGALSIAKQGKKKRVIVFLSDGSPTDLPQTDIIINQAIQNNITIYCLAVEMPAPDFMKQVSSATGGKYFEYIQTAEEAKNYYSEILMNARGIKPCEIAWESQIGCSADKYNVEISVLRNGSKYNLQYIPPVNSNADLLVSPYSIVFKNIVPGIGIDTVVSVQALNYNFEVNDVTSSNPLFTISPTSFNLNKGESIKLKVTYTPSDSSFQKTEFIFKNNLCDRQLLARSVLRSRGNNLNTLKIVSPNGGEEFAVGSDTLITWTGILPVDTVQLDYSYDSGKNWIILAPKASGLEYIWKNVPRPASNNCLVRAKMLNTDLPLDTNVRVQFFEGHKSPVNAAKMTQDYRYIVSGSSEIIIRDGDTYDPMDTVKADAKNLFFSPDGKFVLGLGYSTIIIDLSNGSVKQAYKFFSTPGSMNKAGTILAEDDGAGVKIWDISDFWINLNRTLLTHLTDFPAKVQFLELSSDGNYLLTGCANNTVQLWDIKTSKKLLTYNAQGGLAYVNSIAISDDNSKVAIGGYYGMINVYDTFTGKLIKFLSASTKLIRQLVFSPDGEMLASTCDDGLIYLWDLTSGKVLHSFSGHTGYIQSLEFTPDGNRLISGGSDSLVAIWEIDNFSNIVDSDQSDSLFSIVEPICKTFDIDMGEIAAGTPKDSLVKGFIENIGTLREAVDSIVFKSKEKIFICRGPYPPYFVNPTKGADVEFEFLPPEAGKFSDSIFVFTRTEILKCLIKGVGVRNPTQIVNNIIDFGKVFIGTKKDTLDVYTIKNITTDNVIIDSTVHDFPNIIDFSTISGGGSYTLEPFKPHLMSLRFAPSSIGKTEGTLKFYYKGGGSPAEVILRGEGIDFPPQIKASLDSFQLLKCGAEVFANVTLTNIGGEDLDINSISLEGKDKDDFLDNGFSSVILPKDSVINFKIYFQPNTSGTKFATLHIISNSLTDSLLKINFSATDINADYTIDSNNIELGFFCIGDTKSRNFVISNHGSVKNKYILGGLGKVAFDSSAVYLSPGESDTVFFSSTASNSTDRIDSYIQIQDSICKIQNIVHITGTVITPDLKSNNLTYFIHVNQQAIATLSIWNEGNFPAIINELPPISPPFFYKDNPFPAEINPGDTINIRVICLAADTIYRKDTVVFRAEPCDDEFISIFSVFAYDTLPTAKAVLTAGSAESYAGDLINIPITLNNTNYFKENGIKTLNFDLSFNPTLLEPTNYHGIIANDSTSTINFYNVELNSLDIANIKFRVGLGNAELSELKLSNLSFTSFGKAEITTQNGVFNLLGICPEGGQRLINPNENLIVNVLPNSINSSIQIKIKLIEKGYTSLILTDVTGKLAKEIWKGEVDNFGEQSFGISTTDLRSGMYFIVLKTPTYLKSEKIQIVK